MKTPIVLILLLFIQLTTSQQFTITTDICSYTTVNFVIVTSHGTSLCTDYSVSTQNLFFLLRPLALFNPGAIAQITNMAVACTYLGQIPFTSLLMSLTSDGIFTYCFIYTSGSFATLTSGDFCVDTALSWPMVCEYPIITYETQFIPTITYDTATSTITNTVTRTTFVTTDTVSSTTIVDTTVITVTDTSTSAIATSTASTQTSILTDSVTTTRTRVVTETFSFTETTVLDTTTITSVRTVTSVTTLLTTTISTTETTLRTICTLTQSSILKK